MSYHEKSALSFENMSGFSIYLVEGDDAVAKLLHCSEDYDEEFIHGYSALVRHCQRGADVPEAEEGAADGFLAALLLTNAKGYDQDHFYRLWNRYAPKCTAQINARWVHQGRQGTPEVTLPAEDGVLGGYDPTAELDHAYDMKYHDKLLAERTVGMSEREKEIVAALARGEQRDAICTRLGITVQNYLTVLKRATKKLGETGE